MKHLVPLYCGAWQQDQFAGAQHDLARGDIVVLNGESSGPPAMWQRWLCDEIDAFHERGIAVVGYQHVEWLRRPLAACLGEGAAWIPYRVDGIFRDEAPLVDQNGSLAFLRGLHGQARALTPDTRTGYRKGISAFNPGAGPVPSAWYRSLPGSVWCTFEGPPATYAGRSGLSAYPARESHLIYEADSSTVVDPRVGYGYVTDDGWDGNPWDSWSRLTQP